MRKYSIGVAFESGEVVSGKLFHRNPVEALDYFVKQCNFTETPILITIREEGKSVTLPEEPNKPPCPYE